MGVKIDMGYSTGLETFKKYLRIEDVFGMFLRWKTSRGHSVDR